MAIFKEELNSGWLQHANDMKMVWNAESAGKAEEPSKSLTPAVPQHSRTYKARNVTAIVGDKEASGELVTRPEMHS